MFTENCAHSDPQMKVTWLKEIQISFCFNVRNVYTICLNNNAETIYGALWLGQLITTLANYFKPLSKGTHVTSCPPSHVTSHVEDCDVRIRKVGGNGYVTRRLLEPVTYTSSPLLPSSSLHALNDKAKHGIANNAARGISGVYTCKRSLWLVWRDELQVLAPANTCTQRRGLVCQLEENGGVYVPWSSSPPDYKLAYFEVNSSSSFTSKNNDMIPKLQMLCSLEERKQRCERVFYILFLTMRRYIGRSG